MGYGDSDVAMEDRRFVEDDLTQLAEMDNTIRDMLARRENLVNRIKKANAVNTERVNTSEDWFEGDLRGRPVPARPMGMSDDRDPTQRAY